MFGLSTNQILLNTGTLSGDNSLYYNSSRLSNQIFSLYDNIYIDAGAMTPATGNYPTATTYAVSGQSHAVDSYYFDAFTEQSVYFKFAFPDSWDGGAIKSKVYWDVSTGIVSTGVVWSISAAAFPYNSGFNIPLGAETAITGTVLGNNKSHITISNFINITGVSGDSNLSIFRVARKVADTGDGYSGSARLLGVGLQWNQRLTNVPTLW